MKTEAVAVVEAPKEEVIDHMTALQRVLHMVRGCGAAWRVELGRCALQGAVPA